MFKNLKIRLKLLVGFISIAIIAGIMGIIAITQINSISNLNEKLANEGVKGLLAIRKIETNYSMLRVFYRNCLLAKDREGLDKGLKNIEETRIKFDKSFEEFDKTIASEENRKAFNDLIAIKTEYNGSVDKYVAFLKADNKEEASEFIFKGPLNKSGNNLRDALGKVIEFNENYCNDVTSKTKELASWSVMVLIIIILIGLAVATIIAVELSKGIRNSINGSIQIAKKIAEGNLMIHIEHNQKDEFGILQNELQKMVDNLKNIITSIVENAESISLTSIQMKSNTQQVSEGATQQASSAEEISSSIEEMASNIQQNTDNSQQTEKISAKAASGILESSEAVNQTVLSMREIASKISIISDIAFQTNILALNAAVEAARAGEQGRGFAVVAAEVRKLAERSQLAAGEINNLTKSSVDIADRSGKLLSEIVPDIERTSKLVQEITAASIEQNSGAEQINNAISSLNQVTQQNAAAAEEMATSAEELSNQAEEMKEVVAFFNIGHVAGNSRKPITKQIANKSVNRVSKQIKPTYSSPNKTSTGGGINLNMGENKFDDLYESF